MADIFPPFDIFRSLVTTLKNPPSYPKRIVFLFLFGMIPFVSTENFLFRFLFSPPFRWSLPVSRDGSSSWPFLPSFFLPPPRPKSNLCFPFLHDFLTNGVLEPNLSARTFSTFPTGFSTPSTSHFSFFRLSFSVRLLNVGAVQLLNPTPAPPRD